MMLFVSSATTTCFSSFRSTGKERDTESGNDYFMGRWPGHAAKNHNES
jgi:hypothetical protein